MRPIRLEIEGFTSFRDKCEVDFSSLDLFAITGQTGAGKTSLLDAMTYALYGKTSRLNKAGKDLISQGAASMSVLLHFRVGATEYRVARAIKGSSVTARLERLEGPDWKGLVGSISEISDDVPRIVGLDFDGFTKAIILPQGKFDVFLRGKPDERREVLNDLLDVRVYQRMMQSANERSRLASERAKTKEAEIDLEATPELKAERESELERVSAQKQAIAELVGRLQSALPDAITLREKRRTLSSAELELEKTRAAIARAQIAASSADREVECQLTALRELDLEIRTTAYDSELHLRLTQLEQPALRRENLRTQLTKCTRDREILEQRLVAAEENAQAAGGVLTEIAARLKDASDLRLATKATGDALQARHGSVDTIEYAIKEIERTQAELLARSKFQDAITKLEARAAELSEAINSSETLLANAEAKVESAERHLGSLHAQRPISMLRSELKPGEPCPVCEQTVHSVPECLDAGGLSAAEQGVMAAKAGLKRAQETASELKAESKGIPAEIELARQQLAMRDSALKTANDRATQILCRVADDDVVGQLRMLVEQIQTAKSADDQAQANYERVFTEERGASDRNKEAEHTRHLSQSELESNDKALDACRTEIASLDGLLAGAPTLPEISSQLERLRAAKERRDELEGARREKEAALKQAEALVVGCGKDLEAHEAARSKSVEAIDALKHNIAELEGRLHQLLGNLDTPSPLDTVAHLDQMRVCRQQDLERAQAQVQQCQFAIQTLTERIANNDRLREEVGQQRAEEAVYRDLGNWLNAGNFQQYLLGSAFDLLASEGSKYFSALSSERYTFSYSDKEFQVIDRWNGEEVRSVSTLSGGESFLASLALALALAKSIAELNHVSGATALESLFLDEGFSTLDTETLGKVADALQLLQDGKRLIGIVTHVQSLADEMPARIEIEKTVSGSRIRPPVGTSAAGS